MSEAPQPPPTPAPNGPTAPVAWSASHLVFFRLVFCYFLLYSLPSTGRVSLMPMEGAFSRVWQPCVIWVAVHVFGLSGHAATYFETGSGDTTLGYVENYCYVVLAFAGTLVWSLLDRKRANYTTLHAWFRIWIRFTLAATLLAYGFAKVFPLQMQVYMPKMVDRWGDFTPMAALWNFMGASAPYTILSGSAESLAGLLLFFRRTTLLGAMISFGVMFNVAALNYCYDVPVKLYSTNLVLMSVFIIAPDARRLTQVLLLNQPAPPANLSRPELPRLWMRIVARIVWVVVALGFILYQTAHESWNTYKEIYIHPKHPPIYGLYEVEKFARNGQEAPPLLTDTNRWHWVFFNDYGSMRAVLMNDRRKNYTANQDAAKKTIALSSGQVTNVFTYTWGDTNHLVLRGSLAGDALEVNLHRLGPTNFLLLNRGFHWINEYPLNR
jgi:hypothetical protein